MNDWGDAAIQTRTQRRSAHLTAIVAILFVLGFMNLFLRSSLGVMAPELARTMALGPAALSAVASAFFFAYALMQVPTGMLLDRFGARITLTGMLLFTTVGAATFAAAESVGMLSLGRWLMGMGCAGVFTGAFYVLVQWLPPARVVSQMGTLNSFAASGTLCATTPLAGLIAVIGWRDSYWLFTGAVALVLFTIWLVVRDSPPGAPALASRSESPSAVLRGVGEAMRQPGMMRLLVLGLPISAASTISGVWGAPYLRDVHGLDPIQSGNALLSMAVCAISGHTLLGILASRLNSTRTTLIIGMAGVIGATAVLGLVDGLPLPAAVAMLCVIGFFASFPMVVFSHARGLVPAHLMGRGLSAANTGLMLAIASMQLVFGAVVSQLSTPGAIPPEFAYRMGFAAQAMAASLALLVFWPIRDVKPRA